MALITFILLALNIVVLLAIDIGFWAIGWQVGVAGIIGILAFFIGYALSVELAIAPRDFWWNSEFGIFIKKLGFAWSVALVVWAICYFILGLTCGDPLDLFG